MTRYDPARYGDVVGDNYDESSTQAIQQETAATAETLAQQSP